MKVFTALLCVALAAVATGSPAGGFLSQISDIATNNINKATNIASEKGKEGLAKVQELIAQLQQQAENIQKELQAAATEAQKTASEYVLKGIQAQIEKLKQVEEKLSGWMGKN